MHDLTYRHICGLEGGGNQNIGIFLVLTTPARNNVLVGFGDLHKCCQLIWFLKYNTPFSLVNFWYILIFLFFLDLTETYF